MPLWGSKNEVVAPKWRTQNTFFGAVLEFVLKFAILVLNIKHQNGFFPEHLAPKSVLHLDGVLPERLNVKSSLNGF